MYTLMDFPLQAWAKSSLSTHLVNCKACTNASFNHISKYGHVYELDKLYILNTFWIEWDFVISGIIKGRGVTNRAEG